MGRQLQLGDVTVDVVFKDIKNVHLSVYPPAGRVHVSAPARMRLDVLRAFVIAKLAWIRRQQQKIRGQERETPREYLNRESHYVWGRRYLLRVCADGRGPAVELSHDRMRLRVAPGSGPEKRQAILDEWYRARLRSAVPPLAAKWAPLMGVTLERFYVQRMKTLWGSCNPRARSIRLNTDLAKKPPECLEYIVVHELAHLLEPTHNARFTALLDRFLPNWHLLRDQLNQLPVRHEEWGY